MSDRKYRQHGYQDKGDAPASRPPREAPKDKAPRGGNREGPRHMNMPGFQEVLRCAMCGAVVPPPVEITLDSQCPKCRADLRSCKNCRHFDTGARFECTEPILERVMRKDQRNECTYFVPRAAIERETRDSGGSSPKPNDARSAFDNLFKK